MDEKMRLLVVFLSLFHCAYSVCHSGHLFIGSLDDSLSRYFYLTGIYQKQVENWAGNDVYKHVSESSFLYHLPARLPDFEGAWVVSDTLGEEHDIHLMLESQDADPSVARRGWMARAENTEDEWLSTGQLRAHCVDANFSQCDTGKLRIHGLSDFASVQQHRMGVYLLQPDTQDGRPVYRHSEINQYLHHIEGIWLVGPELASRRGGLLVSDDALRPEFIMQPWSVFAHNRFLTDHQVQVSCEDRNKRDAEAAADGVVPQKQSLPAKQGGMCRGRPPTIANGRILSVTSQKYYPMAIYSCNRGYLMRGAAGVRCGENGEWGSLPSCVANIAPSTPQLDFPTRPRSRSLRSVIHPKTRRSIMREATSRNNLENPMSERSIMRDVLAKRNIMRKAISERNIMRDVPEMERSIMRDATDRSIMRDVSGRNIMRDVGDRNIMRDVSDRNIMRDVGDRNIMRDVSDRGIMRDVAGRNIMRDTMVNRNIMRDVVDRNIMGDSLEDRNIMRDLSDRNIMRDTMSNRNIMRDTERMAHPNIMSDVLSQRNIMRDIGPSSRNIMKEEQSRRSIMRDEQSRRNIMRDEQSRRNIMRNIMRSIPS